jgi:hypothetical protein
MQRKQLNLLLVVAVAGLAALAYYGREREEKGTPLTAIAADALTRIAIEHPGRAAIRLQKAGEQWKLVEPVQAETDSYEVAGITSLAALEIKRSLKPGEVQLRELGLEPPAYRVTLNDVVLGIGDAEPIEARRYVLVGDQVALVEDPPSAALDADYSDLVSKALLPEAAELVKLALPGFTLTRGADAQAWSVQPAQPQAAAEAPRKLVEAWKNARAMWMAAEPPQGSTGEAVTLGLKDGRELRLIVVERDPQLVLARPDLKLRYTLSRALADELLQLSAPPPPAAAAPVPPKSTGAAPAHGAAAPAAPPPP